MVCEHLPLMRATRRIPDSKSTTLVDHAQTGSSLRNKKRHPRLEPLVEQEYNHGHTTHDLLVAFGLGQEMEEGRR